LASDFPSEQPASGQSRDAAANSTLEDVPPERRPRHIAVIMDGNGRWARRRGRPRIEGHRHGVASVRACVEECTRLGIGQLTLYCLSVENWKRPRQELSFLMHLLEQYMIEERATLLREKVRVRMIGRRRDIPDSVITEINKTIDMTAANSGMTLCLAINYGARTELVDAARQIATRACQGKLAAEDIDERTVGESLYTAGMPDPDLLIRTAGEMRVSNFLLWQISYAEIWVTEKCWPDFREPQLHEAIRDYARRDRRFGALNESNALP